MNEEFHFQLRCREVASAQETVEKQFEKLFADPYLTHYEKLALKTEYRYYRWDVFKWKCYVWVCKTILGWRES